jgi:hypothetical protein
VEKKSVEEFQHYTYGIDYPAGKEEVAAVAEGNGGMCPVKCVNCFVRFHSLCFL